MPQYPNARVNFGDIMQAIEDKLIADEVVASAAEVTWGKPSNVPQLSGSSDVVLIARHGQHSPYDGGAGQLPMIRRVDICYRSESVADPGGGFKTWIKSTFVIADEIIDSVGNDLFFPEDTDGNLLTIESIKLVGDVEPDHVRNASAYGDYVCTLECKYFPKVDPTKGP
jgi:hypothetical protein